MFVEAIIPALIPVASDGMRALINKLTGGAGAKPANVGEVVTLMEAETKRLEALAKIDQTGANVSAWVNNIRALQRPVAATMIIGGYLGSFWLVTDQAITANLGTYAQMVTFYLFGDRTYMYMRKGQ